MDSIRLGLIGPEGRMGSALSIYLAAQPDISLAATLGSGGDLAQFIALKPGVALDLSNGAAVDVNGPLIVSSGIPYIIGATGFRAETLDALRAASHASGAPVLIVPNFSLGANLMIRFAAAASRFMASPVITERHHQGKADAPSGTAAFTARRIAEARDGIEPAAPDSTAQQFSESKAGVLGGSADGIALHSIRGTGYLAEQSVELTLPGESLNIEHRSIDRQCFMPGIAYAIRNIGRVVGLQTGLDTILDV